jgi:hypothetical protein
MAREFTHLEQTFIDSGNRIGKENGFLAGQCERERKQNNNAEAVHRPKTLPPA